MEYRSKFECPLCHKSFRPTKHYQIYCSKKCEEIADNFNSKNLLFETICEKCGNEFRRRDNNKRGNVCENCKYANKKIYRINEVINKRLTIPYKPKPKIPLHVLDKKLEYERVYKDSGWKHYLKGRKWDRI